MARSVPPRHHLRRFPSDESGVTMIYTAVMIPVFLGVVGLAAEVAVSHSSSRDARTIADAAAIAGALETARSPNQESVIEAAALTEAVANGYDASSGDQIFIEWKPTSGPSAGDSRAVEVIVQLPSLGLFAGLIDAQSQNVSARSVARRDSFRHLHLFAQRDRLHRRESVRRRRGLVPLRHAGQFQRPGRDHSERDHLGHLFDRLHRRRRRL